MKDKPELPAHPPFSIKRAAKLGMKKHREAERLFLAEGKSLIREAKVAPIHIFEKPEEIKRISSLTASTGSVAVFPFTDVSPEELFGVGRRTNEPEGRADSQIASPATEDRDTEDRDTEDRDTEDRDTEDRASTISGSSPSAIVLLHGVQDPGNVGTVIRSAHAFGAAVALSAGCADLYNPKTVRGTMGAIFHVLVSREVESVEFLEEASRRGFTSVAAMPEGGEPPRNLPDGKLVIVVGSEGSGLPGEVVGACDGRVSIPSLAPSLNAAVAASILLYEAHSRVLT